MERDEAHFEEDVKEEQQARETVGRVGDEPARNDEEEKRSAVTRW